MKNHPDYQGNSEIPLAVGVDLKTSKQTKKTKNKKKKNPTFKTKNKTQGVCWLLYCQTAHECLCSRIMVILDSTPGDKVGI